MAAGKRRWVDLFLIVFFGVQLLVPLRGFLWDKLETRGDFSWNMYSRLYHCRTRYWTVGPDGSRTEVKHWDAFRTRRLASKWMHRDRLPAFHRWLCSELERSALAGSRLRGSVRCSLDEGPYVELVSEALDLCSEGEARP